MIVSLLAAVADNGVIGRDNDLPWRLPADLKRFKSLSVGHTIIMGRKTYESIGRALPDRRTIVLTRDAGYSPPVAEVAPDLEHALAMAEPDDEVFVVGGAAVFRDAIPLAQRLYLTRVHADVEGDVRFPPWNEQDWRLTWEERHEPDDRHPYAFTFQRYDRARA